MNERRFVPIDRIFDAIEDRYQERLPYRASEGNPFGTRHECPIDECDTWRSTALSLDSHLATQHHVISQGDIDRLNGKSPDRRRLRGEERARSIEASRRVRKVRQKLAGSVRREDRHDEEAI